MSSRGLRRPQTQSESAAHYRQKAWAYIELTRMHRYPLGVNFATLPTLWSLAFAARRASLPLADFALLNVAVVIAIFVVNSAACVYNDICDVEFDRQVDRSKGRPLAAGRASLRGACILLSLLVSVALGMLVFVEDTMAILFGLLWLFPLNALYPLMKRWTYWPQAWLGLAINWGILVVWPVVIIPSQFSRCLVPAVLLIGSMCWTIVYDTVYAYQDARDDIRAGVRSTALLFGAQVKPILAAFGAVFMTSLAVSGKLNGQGSVYYVVCVGGSAFHFAWQLVTWRIDNPDSCARIFWANYHLGCLIWLGLVFDYIFHVY
ncbi:UbiA prenyltransferase [Peniophora sp. CONT]|nr:UbiA prenyltransferase [Peniophora sp. CONT]